MDKRWAGRKFALAAVAALAGIVFFSLDMLTAEQWMSHTAWVVGLYTAGNIGDAAVSK